MVRGDSRGREFNFGAFRYLGQVVHTRISVTQQYNLVPVAGQRCLATGKVTVGLALHWPCVTDFGGLSTYELETEVGEMSTYQHSS